MAQVRQPFDPRPGFRVREVRERRGYSVPQMIRMARARGYSLNNATMYRIERAWHPMDVPRVVALADLLEVDPAWLAGFRDGDPELGATG